MHLQYSTTQNSDVNEITAFLEKIIFWKYYTCVSQLKITYKFIQQDIYIISLLLHSFLIKKYFRVSRETNTMSFIRVKRMSILTISRLIVTERTDCKLPGVWYEAWHRRFGRT